ncbi:MAG: tRNA pseudouridine(55) synthase TruB [Gammaproteobacteria bacterium]|nr:tRNA pseudouridine(55) synthase TruB [Gammaproteobacteria bacterium]
MAKQPKGRDISGIVILDKPTGMSSNHALQRVKRMFGARKAGHTGALDPLATGLLPICLGEATKFSQFLLDSDKRYQTKAQLGVRTDSSDADGKVVETKACDHITLADVEAQLPQFRGLISQVPSMFSALKYQGQPLYKLARAGKTVEVKPRQVTIHNLQLMGFENTQIQMDISCTKGTYIRSIVEDLGLSLGCGAHVSQLRRLQAGPFVADQMVTLEDLQAIIDDATMGQVVVEGQWPDITPAFDALDQLLMPVDTAVLSLNAVQLAAHQIEALQQGKVIDHATDYAQLDVVRAYGSTATNTNAFIGLVEVQPEGRLKAKRLMST